MHSRKRWTMKFWFPLELISSNLRLNGNFAHRFSTKYWHNVRQGEARTGRADPRLLCVSVRTPCLHSSLCHRILWLPFLREPITAHLPSGTAAEERTALRQLSLWQLHHSKCDNVSKAQRNGGKAIFVYQMSEVSAWRHRRTLWGCSVCISLHNSLKRWYDNDWKHRNDILFKWERLSRLRWECWTVSLLTPTKVASHFIKTKEPQSLLAFSIQSW